MECKDQRRRENEEEARRDTTVDMGKEVAGNNQQERGWYREVQPRTWRQGVVGHD